MNEVIEAVRYDLVRILADLLIAVDKKTATAALRTANDRIEAALVAMTAERAA